MATGIIAYEAYLDFTHDWACSDERVVEEITATYGRSSDVTFTDGTTIEDSVGTFIKGEPVCLAHKRVPKSG